METKFIEKRNKKKFEKLRDNIMVIKKKKKKGVKEIIIC